MSRRVPMAVAASALVLALLPGTAASTPAESLQETGVVDHVVDGDTIWVDVDGDGTSEARSVRFSNVQAMETEHVNQPGSRDHCHGPQAKARVARMLEGKRVELRAENSTSGKARLLRSVWVRQYGEWTDVQRVLLMEGHVLWLPRQHEWVHNVEYSRLAQEAARRGVGLWNTEFCGSGPNQGARLRMYVQWDASGRENDNLNGEFVVIKNVGDSDLPLRGWHLRDSSHDGFRFPAGAIVPAGKSIKVHVGRGKNTARTFYWRSSGPKFENVDSKAGGDGAYLLDPDEDLRSWFMYPCRVKCRDSLQRHVRIRGVVADALGVDADNANGEVVKIRSRASHRVGLEGYVLRSWPYSYAFPRGTYLKPGETLKLKVGKGQRSRLTHFWGMPKGILNNTGDAVELESFAAVRIDCTSWGTGSC